MTKNKTKDFLKRNKIFTQKIAVDLKYTSTELIELEIDLSPKNIMDSQLQMMFAICHPSIPKEAQTGLSLRILCGFGIDEIADAFLSNKETINKRLCRAKEKLKEEKISMELPFESELANRLQAVLTTLYLLFNEGYYSASQNTGLRKDLCLQAMRLNLMLTQYDATNKPFTNALLALMCFHAPSFDARLNKSGEMILYEEQDTNLWHKDLIQKGEYYLNQSANGNELKKYHLEAAIAYWHTQPADTKEKWNNILQLYNKLLQIEYSATAALNRTFALAKADSNAKAIIEAHKLNLDNHLYYALLGHLYAHTNKTMAIQYFNTSLSKARTDADKQILIKKLNQLADK